MSGTKIGGLKTAQTNKDRYGENWYCVIGSRGGKAKVPKGFAMNRERASEAGAKGGRISRRTKAQ